MMTSQPPVNVVLTQDKKQTLHFRAIFGIIVAMLFAGVTLCHAEAAETTILGIKYTKVGEGMCRASMVEAEYPRSSYEVKSPVTIDGEECRVTSISDMGINAKYEFRGRPYDVYLATYKIKLPEFVDTICAHCFEGPGEEYSWYHTYWSEFSFPKTRVIGSYAFASCEGLVDIVIPEGVEEIGYLINGHEYFNPTILSLPSTLKRMSALAVSREELTPSVTIWASTPPEIIPLSNGCDLPITDPYGLSADSLEYANPYATIYVPAAAIEAYKAAPGWCKVPNILPIKSGSIDGVASDGDGVRFEVGDGSITAVNGEAPVEVYATDGRRVAVGADGTVSGLDAGLYIVRCGATATKLMVR